MELIESLEALAIQNYNGVSFLFAYAFTWIVCGILWRKINEKSAGYATLFQGMIAFPVAIGLSYAIGALGEPRPVGDTINQLAILIGMSQVLGIPFLIYLAVKNKFELIPYAFAVFVTMHFVLYSWLYQTPYYIVMALVISIGGMIIMVRSRDDETARKLTASRVCLFVGFTMILTSAALLLN